MNHTTPRHHTVSRLYLLVAILASQSGCFGIDLGSLSTAPRPPEAAAPSAEEVAAESRASREHLQDMQSKRAGGRLLGVRKSQCGARGQRPCYVWEAIPSCDSGLVENLLAHRCVSHGADGALAASAKATARDLSDLLETLGGYISCFDPKVLERAIRKADAAYAQKLQRSPCIQRMGAIAAERGYRTMTVGLSGGGALILGGFVDTGFAFDTAGRRAPTLYQTKAVSIGFQAGGGVGLNIGLYKGTNAIDTRGTDTQGFSFEAGAGAGAGTGIWYDYDGKLDGVSVSAIAGASGKAGAYNRLNTAYYDPKGNNPMVCGGVGQRACKLWERIPSCDPGLAEDLKNGMCRRPKQFTCGGRNQRPCKLWERVPSCNRGLHEDFLAGRCKG